MSMKAELQKCLFIIDALTENIGKLFSYLVIVIMLLQVYEAVMRYIFKAPSIWSWELGMLLYGAHFMLGGAWVMKQNQHVRTDILLQRFSKKKQALLEVILFGTIFFTFVTVMVYKQTDNALYSLRMGEKTFTEWAPPFYPLKIIIAVSFFLLALQGLARWVRQLHFLITDEEI